jgi:hypothetical protein
MLNSLTCANVQHGYRLPIVPGAIQLARFEACRN